MKTYLKHPCGIIKPVKRGFSWTTLFFGFFPALFRGDLKWACIMFICAWITAGISLLVFPFIYNNIYENELREKGYKEVE
jgi:hypothetical protein